MITTVRLCLLVTLALVASSLLAADEQYLVETRVWLDGELAGTPTLIVQAGQPASIERAGEPHFRLSLMVEPARDRFAPLETLWLTIEVEVFGDDGWEPLVDSLLGVHEGRTASLSLVDGDAESSPETARLFVEVKPSHLRPADAGP